MGRPSKPFKLTPAEVAALDAARKHHLAWHEGLPPMKPKVLAELRKTARAMSESLLPVLGDGGMNPTRARLLVRMQEAELCQKPQEYYWDHLLLVNYTMLVIDRACAAEVRRGRKSDERAGSWIRNAAAHWRAAGLTVAARGRFGAALAQYHAPGIPSVIDAGQIALALKGAGELQTAFSSVK
jgi:hypothetical protein